MLQYDLIDEEHVYYPITIFKVELNFKYCYFSEPKHTYWNSKNINSENINSKLLLLLNLFVHPK